MRTYNQAISYIAKNAFGDYLSGGYGQFNGVGMVAFIYGKTHQRVTADTNKMLDTIKNEHYRQYEQKEKA
jgi:hypothetical protein